MAYLTVRIKGEEGHRTQKLDQDRMELGRTREAGISIRHESISRHHCTFIKEGDRWYVEDAGSSNGTRVGDEVISGRQALAERDIVKVGKARLTFHAGEKRVRKAQAIDIAIEDHPSDLMLTREVGDNDPRDAIPCGGCHVWLNISHRLPGDQIVCPNCKHKNSVPQLIS